VTAGLKSQDLPQKTLVQDVELPVRSTFILGQTKDLMSAVGRQTVAPEAFDQVELSYIAAISRPANRVALFRHSSPATHHPTSSPNRCVIPVSGYRTCSVSLRLRNFTDPVSSVCTECHCAAHIRFTAFRAHLSCAHQPSLVAYP